MVEGEETYIKTEYLEPAEVEEADDEDDEEGPEFIYRA